MPVINIELNDLNRMLKEPINSDEFSEIIPQIGSDPDEINDKEAIVEFFPDRPDLLSTEGVARAIRAFSEQQLGLVEYVTKKPSTHITISKEVLDIRPEFLGGIVRGVKLDDISIKCLMELQEKLHITLGRKRSKVSIGIHDLAKLKPPFSYTTCSPHEPTFVPLQNDYEMTSEEILKDHPKGIEYAHLLTDFDKYPLIIDSEDEVISEMQDGIFDEEDDGLEKDTSYSFTEEELKEIVSNSVQKALEKSIADSLVELAVSELKTHVNRLDQDWA